MACHDVESPLQLFDTEIFEDIISIFITSAILKLIQGMVLIFPLLDIEENGGMLLWNWKMFFVKKVLLDSTCFPYFLFFLSTTYPKT